MSKPVINLADIKLQPRPPAFSATGPAAERYDARMGMVGAVIGAKKLGYNITEVPPGKRAFPPHSTGAPIRAASSPMVELYTMTNLERWISS